MLSTSIWAAARTKLGAAARDLDCACSSHPAKAIQRKYSLPGWIPLLRDGEGNAIGVDLDPGPAGVIGQVINFGRDEDDKYVLFSDVSELINWLAREVAEGRIAYDAKDQVVRHVEGRLVAVLVDRVT